MKWQATTNHFCLSLDVSVYGIMYYVATKKTTHGNRIKVIMGTTARITLIEEFSDGEEKKKNWDGKYECYFFFIPQLILSLSSKVY